MNSSKPKHELQTPSRWPHRVGVVLTLVVFPLIWVGGLVTTYDAGMAVPDWPNTYNYNMFAYPVRDWFFGPWDLFVEHGHRLLGSLAGIICIVLLVVTWQHEPRKWVRWMSIWLLVLVIFQGVLGGARVLMDERFIAKVHGCVGPAFFAACCAFCVFTSNWWLRRVASGEWRNPDRTKPTLLKWSIAMLVLAFAQLVMGAFLRHVDISAPPSVYRSLVMSHVGTAVVLGLGTLIQWYGLRSQRYSGRGIRASINILMLLILAQITLGFGTWIVKYGWPVWFENWIVAAQFVVPEKTFWQMNIITAHQAVGSLILAYWTVHVLRCHRDWAWEITGSGWDRGNTSPGPNLLNDRPAGSAGPPVAAIES